MRLGEMRRHPSYTYLRSAKRWYRKRWWTTKQSLSKRQKTTKQVVVVGPPIKKKIRRNGIKRNEIRRNATQPCEEIHLEAALEVQSSSWRSLKARSERRNWIELNSNWARPLVSSFQFSDVALFAPLVCLKCFSAAVWLCPGFCLLPLSTDRRTDRRICRQTFRHAENGGNLPP